MMKYTPAIRGVLTFLAAGLSVVIATVNNETARIIGSAIIVGLAAVGIVPPHIPTRTSVDPGTEPVNVVHEDGYADGGGLLLLVLLAVLIIVAVPVAHVSAAWLLLLLLVALLVIAL